MQTVKRRRTRSPVRHFLPSVPEWIVRDGIVIGSLRTQGIGSLLDNPLLDARTMNGGTLGSFAERERAIAALEEFANRKRKRRKGVESATRTTSTTTSDFEGVP
jgi:hypothetical protein